MSVQLDSSYIETLLCSGADKEVNFDKFIKAVDEYFGETARFSAINNIFESRSISYQKGLDALQARILNYCSSKKTKINPDDQTYLARYVQQVANDQTVFHHQIKKK